MASKSASTVTAVTVDLLMLYKKYHHTIMADNSLDFSYHEKIAKDLDVEIHFLCPLHCMETRKK
ncbi:hypothetical protein [Candidatus Enterovibrio escicola]|uniref:Mobile element protein n=1 Tax=Candidatus Enterovibrio escicola TaxID=1927127 RepID=A0A2A5T380_9GAMM|nr:hypothetical protein [Candidatus Enterovibrio escacola]PCS22617.1 hypothetical protein BTN49_1843 [Candidatus Enterovibrio escacola]